VSARSRVLSLGVALALAVVSPAAGRDAGTPADGWRAFAGTWSATGVRQAVTVERGEEAAVVDVSGAVVLTNGEGLGRGFSGRAIGYDDGEGRSSGRCVWTDANGDRLFSRIEGEPLQAGRRLTGTITGGTGRYDGLEGEYSFTWQYVSSSVDGSIQGRAVGLAGRVRRAERPR
jgi:hypothetical protein